MRKRLAICLAFALLGILFSFPVSDHFNIGLPLAVLAGALAGLAFGYITSIMFDVFLGVNETEPESENLCAVSPDRVCSEKKDEMKFSCDACGSISATSDNLCMPVKIG